MSLKAMLASLVAVLAALVLAAAGSLVVLTSYLHHVTDRLGAGMQGVLLAEEVEVDLFTHYRQSLELPRESEARALQLSTIERRILARLDEMSRLNPTLEEQVLIEDIRGLAANYLRRQREAAGERSAEASRALDQAVARLEELVEINVVQAHEAQTEAARWDRMARVGGPAVALVLLVSMLGVRRWLRRSVLRPVTEIRQAMRRFSSGHKRTRAPETGPTELREVARTFNEMATAIGRQQEDQLAFLAGVAHDLRNPLSALKMSTALATPGRGDPSPERVQKMLALVRRQVARLDRMVGDLLDATRIEAGKLELQLRECDARELARAVVELYQATGQSHELRLELPEAPILLNCDGARIEQVLNNLVSNALKYSPAGTRVDVTVSREGEEALFAVADQGIGISAEERRHLFAPFKRASGARAHAPGAGLGLSVARRIVEAHGGRIEVDSQPGHGSVFRIRLPLSRAAMQPEPRTSEPSHTWTPGDAVH
jgi:two-component system, OmpR family, sensor histidine kinase MtrB